MNRNELRGIALFLAPLLLMFGFLVAVTTHSGCKSIGGVPVKVAISNVVNCSEATIAHELPAVLTDVTTALSTTDYVSALIDLTVKVGGDVVACAVRQVKGEAMARFAASGQAAQNQQVIAVHANSWIIDNGVNFAP